jgi:pimeloyl-ACP methyl ester carboxylesterase
VPFVAVAGAALDVELVQADARAAERPALVFLHEGLGSIELWRSFPADVRAAAGGPAVLVYSRAGYGRSAAAHLPRPVTYMHIEADDVLPALLAQLGIERPVLIGHSDGASIALLFAGAGRPVAGLVLIAPHVFVEEVSIRSIFAAREAFETTDLRARMGRYHDDVDAAFRGWNDVWLSPEFRSWNIEDRLPAVRCPLLLVQGADDPYGTTAQLDAIEAGVCGPTRRVLIPNVGHAPHLEAPDVTTEAVAEFLAAIGTVEAPIR